MELYAKGKRRVFFMLQTALSSIHITCHPLTTANHLGAWDVVSHFTSEEGLLRELLLLLFEQERSHSGQNPARLVLKTLTSYKIRNELGHLVINNALTNDTLMQYIAEDLKDERIAYDPWQHGLRCNGHIINLPVCAFLFGKHPDAERQAGRAIESRACPSIQEPITWRRVGPLGKLHNIIVYIIASPQRIQPFNQQRGGHIQRRDNKMRRNSWYMMLHWSLTKTRVSFFLGEERPKLMSY